ncbi:hypothetical protein HYQ46_009761 [Verticillium longisporum]|nr:hypothetical protein HYQ46_009761 [Verticillium longisporum]
MLLPAVKILAALGSKKLGTCSLPSDVRLSLNCSCQIWFRGTWETESATKKILSAGSSSPSCIQSRMGRRYIWKHSKNMRPRNSYAPRLALLHGLQGSIMPRLDLKILGPPSSERIRGRNGRVLS